METDDGKPMTDKEARTEIQKMWDSLKTPPSKWIRYEQL